MSDHGVYPNEMNEPQDLDPSLVEPLLSGGGHETAPRLAQLIGDMRVVYSSTLPVTSPELSALLGTTATAPASSAMPRRFEKMRSSMLAKIGGATAALVAATGGLAVAQALPAPAQNAFSHLGIGAPAHHSDATSTPDSTTLGPTTTTVAPQSTPTTVNHGEVVSGVAHDHSTTGCDHGVAVSNVASDGRSQHNPQTPSTAATHIRSCNSSTTTTVESATTTTTTNTQHGNHGSTTASSHPELGAGGPRSSNGGHTNNSNRGH